MYIKKNLDSIQQQIKEAAEKRNKSIGEITLIAVTKTQPIKVIKEVVESGILHLGENRVQELLEKTATLPKECIWHMIGHLQTNKVKNVIDKVALIHSVDSLRLAKVINDEAMKTNKVQDILIQVNIARENTKFGVLIEDLEELIQEISKLKNIQIKGLMTVAPFVENPEENRPIFKNMYQVLVDINSKNIDNVTMNVLSMGMTNDFAVAIEEGATMVRIGTAIFGQRNL